MADAPKIAVLGAGSVGCFVGGTWQASDLPITFVGRPRIADEIAAHGLTASDYDGWEVTLPASGVDFRTDPAAIGDADIIALCVKSGATAGAAAQIAEHGRDGALVLSLQNGIGNVDILSDRLGSRFRVVRGMVPFNVAHLGEGRFHKGVAGLLFAEDLPEMRALAERIGRSAAGFRLSDDMLGVAWGKLLINLNNAVNALSGRTLKAELSDRDYRRVFAATMREGLRLLDRAGITPAKVGAVGPRLLPRVIAAPDWVFRNVFLKAWKFDDKARSSMADDLAHGRMTEIDILNGEIVRLAERLNADAPLNRRIIELVRDAERGGRHDWAPADLRREILGR